MEKGKRLVEEAAVLHDRAVEALEIPEFWALVLRLAAFHIDQRPLNVLMIAIQKPNATDIRTRAQWESAGFQVRDNARGMVLFAQAKRMFYELDRTRLEGMAEELTCIRYLPCEEAFDASQTTAADDPSYQRAFFDGMASLSEFPRLSEFVEGWAVQELEDWQGHVPDIEGPIEQRALARLQHLAHLAACGWITTELEAESAAHLVATLAGLPEVGDAPVPVPDAMPESTCNSPLKVSALAVIQTARVLFAELAQMCRGCGNLGDCWCENPTLHAVSQLRLEQGGDVEVTRY